MKKLKKFFITSLSILSISATTVPLVALVSSCSDTSEEAIDPNVFHLGYQTKEINYENYIVNYNENNYLMLPEANAYLIDLNSTNTKDLPEINYIVFPKSNFNLYGSILINGLESFRGFLWNGNNFSSEPPKSVPAWDKNYKVKYSTPDFVYIFDSFDIQVRNCTKVSSHFKFPTTPIRFYVRIANSTFKEVDLSNQKNLWLNSCWGYLYTLSLPFNLTDKDFFNMGDYRPEEYRVYNNGIFYSGANNNRVLIPKEIEEFTWCFAGDRYGIKKFEEISFEEGSKFYISKEVWPSLWQIEAPFNGYIPSGQNSNTYDRIWGSQVEHLNFFNCKNISNENLNVIKKNYEILKNHIDKITLPDGSVLYPNNPERSIIK